MNPIIIVSPWITKALSIFIEVGAITLFPFVISREPMDEDTLRHETIHIHQQIETLVIGFYLLYALFYIIGYIKYRDPDEAYYRIPFEQEAYTHSYNKDYIKERKAFSWIWFRI